MKRYNKNSEINVAQRAEKKIIIELQRQKIVYVDFSTASFVLAR